MNIVCLDLEGVLVPEIWIAFAKESGIPELTRTTRDEPDYDKLMKWRLGILKEHGLGLKEIQDTIAKIDPIPGAKEFLDELRSITQVIIISDTFSQFAGPLMKKLGYPTIFCNGLIVAEDGEITGFKMRCEQSKLTTVKALQSIGGFNVHVTTYLFRLRWNDDIANTFYQNYYTEDGNTDKDKVEAFKKDNQLFKMEFVGKTEAESKETHFKASKDPQALLLKVTTRTMDHNLASLQQIYPDFRIKAPLLSVDPLTADVGLKEDVTENTRFEVLERVIDEQGKMSYVQVGLIKPVKGKIKDNRFMAEEDAESTGEATEFEKISGKDFYPGMLIREITE